MSEVVFTNIYKQKAWGGVSVSGPGSDLVQTSQLRVGLTNLIKDYNIKTILDAPCGDFYWMKEMYLANVEYVGGDIVSEIIMFNSMNHSKRNIKFKKLDIVNDELLSVDLMFTRDCLVHFSFDMISKFLHNLKRSNIKYFASTSFISRTKNQDINVGEWRPLNLLQSPFNLPNPIRVINEGCTENGGQFYDKSICLWEVANI